MKKFVVLSVLISVCSGIRAYSGDPKIAQVVRSEVDVAPDGSYQYIYETENGISASQQGAPKQLDKDVLAIVAQGSYQYSATDGDVKVEYVADENGYQPTGNILPTPPPIPKGIVRLLEYIASHPQPQTEKS